MLNEHVVNKTTYLIEHIEMKTTPPIGSWKCNLTFIMEDRPTTDQPTNHTNHPTNKPGDQPTNQQTDIMVQKEVATQITVQNMYT